MINEAKINIIQEKLKKAIDLIEKEENVKIDFGSISFNVAQYRSVMSVSSLDKSEKIEKVYSGIDRFDAVREVTKNFKNKDWIHSWI